VTFLPLIGVQKTVALINEKLCPTANQNETFTLTNIITIVVCILFWILIVAATVSNSQQQQTQ
jgi:hypothetical protein